MPEGVLIALIGGGVSLVLGVGGVILAVKLNLPALGVSISTEQVKLIEALRGRIEVLEARVEDLEEEVVLKAADIVALNAERRRLERENSWLKADLDAVTTDRPRPRRPRGIAPA